MATFKATKNEPFWDWLAGRVQRPAWADAAGA
jgi:hypothetical protein